MELKSTAELIKEIDFKKEVVIKRILADPIVIKQQRVRYANVVSDGKKLAPEVIDAEIQFSMFKDNIFSAIMNEIVTCFTFKIDKEEKDVIMKRLERDFSEEGKDGNSEENKIRVELIAEQMIKKHLIFQYLQNLWKVVVSDDEVKEMLEIFYKKTNQSVHDILENKERFENVRQTILEEKLVLKIINSFLIRFELAAPTILQGPEEEKANASEKKKN